MNEIEAKTEFHRELIKLTVDKLLIGAIIILAGYIVRKGGVRPYN